MGEQNKEGAEHTQCSTPLIPISHKKYRLVSQYESFLAFQFFPSIAETLKISEIRDTQYIEK